MAAPFSSLDLSRGLAGKALIALPHLSDTPFERSVCLICSHDDEHAFGVIINKPMQQVAVPEVLAEMKIDCDAASGSPVFFGGPVDLQRGAVLHTLDYRQEDTVLITPEIGLTATKDALHAICTGDDAPRKWKLLMGHAGWDGGQLEGEIKRNDWLLIDAPSSLVFGQSEDLWESALGQLGVTDPALFTTMEQERIRPN